MALPDFRTRHFTVQRIPYGHQETEEAHYMVSETLVTERIKSVVRTLRPQDRSGAFRLDQTGSGVHPEPSRPRG